MELDPTTNLPKDRATSTPSPERLLRSYQQAQTRGIGFDSRPVGGTFGKYDEDLNVTSDRNFNELRAKRQGYFELMGKAAAQTIGGIIVGGTVSGIGYLFDLPEYLGTFLHNTGQNINRRRELRDMLSKGEISEEQYLQELRKSNEDNIAYDFERNAISNLGHNIEKTFFENFEIYQTERAQSGEARRWADPTHRFSMYPSIASTISLMIPAGAVAMGLRAAGRGLMRATGRTGVAAQRINQGVTTIGTAVASRHNYNMMEGFDVMDRYYEQMLESGRLPSEAKELAAKAAGEFYKTGYANLWKDMIAWGALLRGFNYASLATTRSVSQTAAGTQNPLLRQLNETLRKNPSASVKQAIKGTQYTWKDWLLQAGLEGFEEFNIQFQKNLAMRNSDIILGIEEGDVKRFAESYFSSDWLRELRNPETQDATLMGFLGGATFQGAGLLARSLDQRRSAARVTQEVQRIEQETNQLKENLSLLDRLSHEGPSKVEFADAVRSKMVVDSALMGLHNQNLANTIELYEAVAQLTPEQATEAQLGENAPAEAKRVVQELNRIQQIYNKNAETNMFESAEANQIFNLYLTEEQYILEKAKERQPKVNNLIDEFFNRESIQAAMKDMDGGQRALVRKKARLHALRRLHKDQDLVLSGLTRGGRFRARLNNKVKNSTKAYIESEISQLEAEIKDTVETEATREFVKNNLKEAEFNENMALAVQTEAQIQESQELIKHYMDPETRSEVLRQRKLSEEKLNQEIFDIGFKTEAPDGHYIHVVEDNATYQVSHRGDGVYLTEFNTETQEFSGESFKASEQLFLTDEGRDKTRFTIPPEDIIAPKERKKLIGELAKDLKNNRFDKALHKVSRMYVSGMQEQAGQALKEVQDTISRHIDSLNSVSELRNFLVHSIQSLGEGRIAEEINTAVYNKINQIKEQLNEEVTRLKELVKQKPKQVQQAEESILKIEESIAQYEQELRSARENPGAEYLAQETARLQQAKEKAINEGQTEAEANAVFDVEMAKVIKAMESKESKFKRDTEALLHRVESRLTALKAEREQLRRQKDQLIQDEKTLNKLMREYKDLHKLEDIIPPVALIKDRIGEQDELAKIRDKHLLNNWINFDALKVRYAEIDARAQEAIDVLGQLHKVLSRVSQGNEFIWEARQRTINRLWQDGFFHDTTALSRERLVRKYREYLLQEIKEGQPSQQDTEVFKAITRTQEFLRSSDVEAVFLYGDISPGAYEAINLKFSEVTKSSMRVLRQYNRAALTISSYERVLSEIQQETAQRVDDVDMSLDLQDDNSALRRPEKHLNRTTGKDHHGSKRVEDWQTDAGYRFGVFVNNVNPYINDLQLKIVDPETVGITIPEEVKEQYGESRILYAVVMDSKGEKYYTVDGRSTDSFDPDVSIYTSLPDAESKLRYASSDEYIANLFPNIENPVIREAAFSRLISQRQEEHKALLSDIYEQLDSGEDVFLGVLGKNRGVPVPNRQGVKRPYTEVISENHTLVTADGPVTVVDVPGAIAGPVTFASKPGRTYAYEHETGNIISVSSRNLNQVEVDTVVEVLKHHVEKTKIEKGKVKKKGVATKIEVDGVDVGVYDIFNSITHLEVHAHDNKIYFGKKSNGAPSLQLFATEKGKVLNKLHDEAGIRERLKEKYLNIPIDSKKISTTYRYEEGAFKATNYESVSEFISKNDTGHTEVTPKQTTTLTPGGVEVNVNDVQFMNQGLEFHNPHNETLESFTQTYTDNSKKLSTLNKGLFKEHITEFSEKRVEIREQAEQLIRDWNRGKTREKVSTDDVIQIYNNIKVLENTESRPGILSELNLGVDNQKTKRLPSAQATDMLHTIHAWYYAMKELGTKEGSPVWQKSGTSVFTSSSSQDGFNVVWSKTGEEKYGKDKDKTGETDTQEGYIEIEWSKDVKEKPPTKPPTTETDASRKSKLSRHGIRNKPSEQKVTDSEQISFYEGNRIMNNLTKRTGVKFSTMSHASGFEFLNRMYREGKINNPTKYNEVPYGMYWNGQAYVFGEIYLETPFHEVSHGIVNQIINDNNSLFEKLKQQVETNAPEVIKHIKEHYPALLDSQGDLSINGWAEAITTVMGKEAVQQYKIKETAGFKQTVANLWQAIKDYFIEMFGGEIRVEDLSSDTTLAELGYMLGYTNRAFALTPQDVVAYQKKDVSLEALKAERARLNENTINIVETPKDLDYSSLKVTLPGKDSYFTSKAMDTYHAMFIELLNVEYGDNVFGMFSPQGQEVGSVYSKVVNELKTELGFLVEEYLQDANNATEQNDADYYFRLAENYQYLADNYSDVVELHKQKLQQDGFEVVVNEENIRQEEVYDEGQEEITRDTAAQWNDSFLTRSSKQSATTPLRLLISSLQDHIPASETTTESVRMIEEFNRAGVVDFGNTWNILANALAGKHTVSQMKAVLAELKYRVPGVADLMDRVFVKNPNKLQLALQLQFFQAFSKYKSGHHFAFVDSKGNFGYTDAMVNTAQSRLRNEWQSNFARLSGDSNVPHIRVRNGVVTYNTKWFREKFGEKNFLQQYDQILGKSLTEISNNKRKFFVETAYLLGIDLREINTLPDRQTVKSLHHILELIVNGEDHSVTGTYSAATGYMTDIYNFALANMDDYVDNQYQNFSGETQYAVNLNSYLTLIEAGVNSSNTLQELYTKFPFLDSAWTNNSVVLNKEGVNAPFRTKFFDAQGRRKESIEMSYDEGIINESSRDRVPYKKMTFKDRILYNLNAVTSGIHPVFTPGDNTLKRTYPTGTFVTDMADFKSIVTGYLHSEVAFFREMLNNPESYLEADYSDNPAQKSMFYEVLKKSNLVAAFNNAVTESTGRLPQNLDGFNAALESYITELRDNTVQFLENEGIIEQVSKKENTYINRGVSHLTKISDKDTITRNNLNTIVQRALMNKAIWNVEQTKLFTGHPSFYGNADNFFKRMSTMVGTNEIAAADASMIPLINKHYPRKANSPQRLYRKNNEVSTEYSEGAEMVTRSAVYADNIVISELTESEEFMKMIDEGAQDYLNMNEADGLSIISIDFYRDLRMLVGDWLDQDERLYQWVKRPKGAESIQFENSLGEIETVTESELINPTGSRTTFPMLKPKYFGPLAEQGYIPALYKTGMVPLIPTLPAEHEHAHQMMEMMAKNNVDIVSFESANKVGMKLQTEGTKQQLYKPDGTLNTETPITQDTYTKFWGVQLKTGRENHYEVIKGSQFMKLIASDIYDKGKATKSTLAKQHKKFVELNNQLIELGVQNLKDTLGIIPDESGHYNQEAVDRLIDYLEKQSIRRGANNNIIMGLRIMKQRINAGLGFDIMPNRDKVENILASIVDKEVFSQKMFGSPFIQSANTVLVGQGARQYRKYKDRNLQRSSENLKLRSNGVLEVMIPHRFKEILGDVSMDKIDKRLLEAIGFRIPTSGLNSIENIVIKGFLPQEYGDTIVLPSEIVAKAGSDFDIDKLNVFIPNYNIKKDGETIQSIDYVEYDAKNPTFEGVQNELMQTASRILADTQNKKSLLTPIGTSLINAQAERISKLRNQPIDRGDFSKMTFDFVYQSEVEQRNLTSKPLTGIYALHVTDHIMAQIYDYQMPDKHKLHFEEGSYNVSEGNISLGGVNSATKIKGKTYKISEVLNQLLNAAVDGAKNPIFNALNISMDTANVIAYLIRAGVSIDNVMTFMNQPIIRDYIKWQSVEKSQTTPESFTNDTVETKINKKYGVVGSSENISWKHMERNLNPEQMDKKTQRRLLRDYKEYVESANTFNNYVQAARLDTEAIGKNTSELDLKLEAAERLNRGADGVGIINANRIVQEGGYMEGHFKALKEIKKAFSQYFIHTKNPNSQFARHYSSMVSRVFNKTFMSNKNKVAMLDKYKSDFIAAVVMNNNVRMMHGESFSDGAMSGEITRLFTGENSTARRLKALKETSNNLFIKALTPVFSETTVNLDGNQVHIDNIRLLDQRLDTIEQNRLIDSWVELFETDSQLAMDLVATTFMQSGLQLSPITFTKYIPADVYMETVLSAFQGDYIGDNINMEAFDAHFIFNNAHSDFVVPTVQSFKKQGKQAWFKTFPFNKEYEKLDKAGKERWRENRKPIFDSMPEIYVNMSNKEAQEIFNVNTDFTSGVYRLVSNGFQDRKTNKALLSYGSDLYLLKRTTSELSNYLKEGKLSHDVMEKAIVCK